MWIRGFSWDGSLAIAVTYGCPAPRYCAYIHARIIRWRDGAVLRLGQPNEAVVASEAGPGGRNIAFETQDLSNPPASSSWMSGEIPGFVYVVSADGHVLARLKGGSVLSGLSIN